MGYNQVRGSSPLTRGKPAHAPASSAGERLIPAHAGKTPSSGSACRRPPAHPRSRGENFMCSAGLPRMNGSSPLTRGKPLQQGTGPFMRRLIPAHAGKTMSRVCPFLATAAHPRSRGENGIEITIDQEKSGSSPLTRGKRAGGVMPAGIGGLIPAHAGKTGRGLCTSLAPPAHPRSRGENDA